MSGRREFEQSCREQNVARALEVVAARHSGAPCVIVEMLAFGGVPYCTTHRVMGACTFGGGK